MKRVIHALIAILLLCAPASAWTGTRWYASNTTDNLGSLPGGTYVGTWDDTNSAAKDLKRTKSAATVSHTNNETVSTNPLDVVIVKLISPSLQAQTVTGRIRWIWPLGESSADMDCVAKVHVAVITSSNTLRCTLLGNQVEATEYAVGSGFSVFGLDADPVDGYSVTPCAITTGDRVIVEVGCRATNSVTTSYTAYMAVGGDGTDITDGQQFNSGGNHPGWIEWEVEPVLSGEATHTPTNTPTSAFTNTPTQTPTRTPTWTPTPADLLRQTSEDFVVFGGKQNGDWEVGKCCVSTSGTTIGLDDCPGGGSGHSDGANCTAGSFPAGVDANGAVQDCQDDITGNAATATALAANGSNCLIGQFPLGVDASGAVEDCSTTLLGNASTATALEANGANCSAGSFPLGVDASGAVESCSTSITGNADTATALAANGGNCTAGQAAGGVSASGVAEDCAAYITGAESGGGLQAVSGELALRECSTGQLVRDNGAATWDCTTGLTVDGSGNLTAVDVTGTGDAAFDTLTVGAPNGTLGAFQIEGTAASDSLGPHIPGYVSTDLDYPVYHLFAQGHDDVGIWFDANDSSLGPVSADAGSNFGVIKAGDLLTVLANSGTAAGSTFSPTTAITVQPDGDTFFGGSGAGIGVGSPTFAGKIIGTLRGTKTHDFASIAAQGTATTTVTVLFALDGYHCYVSHTAAAYIAGVHYTCYISATNTATIVAHNYASTSKDPASGTFTVFTMATAAP